MMDIVQSVNRNWIYDTYLSLYRALHPGGKVRQGNVWGDVRIPVGADDNAI